jgi:hypothetical protein
LANSHRNPFLAFCDARCALTLIVSFQKSLSKPIFIDQIKRISMEDFMKYAWVAFSVLIMGSLAQAKIYSGTYSCLRDGKIVKSVKVSMEKLGGVELPVLEFNYPLSDEGIKRTGLASIVQIGSETHYVLGNNESISFGADGSVRSDDDCRKTQ